MSGAGQMSVPRLVASRRPNSRDSQGNSRIMANGSSSRVEPGGLDEDLVAQQVEGPLAAPAMKPGDKLDFVVFFPNGELLSSNYTVTTAAGSVETTSTQGSGSATLDVAAAGDGGSAVAVNGIATGTNAHQAIPSVGIVGTIMTNCDACTGTWTTPDGRSGAWEVPSSTYPFGSEFQFVGPAGSWNWTWTGEQQILGESSADYGAYVPVGDDWSLFRSGSAT